MHREVPRILVVDDEPDMCWALERILQTAGYEVSAATSASEALELVAKETHAVAFVDAKLPDADGRGLTALIQRVSPDTVTVLVSGYYDREDEQVIRGLEQGLFERFIAKPFEAELVRMVAHMAVERATPEGEQ